ncbi:MAG: threonine synthase [Burkholderiales bacterium]
MSYYIDSATGTHYPLTQARWCGDSGAPLSLGPSPVLRRGDIDTAERSVWRYAKALLVPREAGIVSLGEGWTPLLDGAWAGAGVSLKLEFMMPTGSFKDRGMTVMMSYLKQRGLTAVLEDSSGNAGASMAAYAAAAGMQARILVPETASFPKIAQIAAAGADVITIPGSRQDVADAALRHAGNIFYASHNWQAFFVEGTKTLAYELWEQMDFEVPDNVIVPLGYGSNVLGCARGFAELRAAGEIDRVPRLYGVQAANCAPLFNAFEAGMETLVPTTVSTTVAEGIASQKPTHVRGILRATRETNGAVVAVSEAEIIAALGTLARRGLYVEPTGATALAGLTQLLDRGKVRAKERTVVVLTGTGLKASERIGELLGVGARLEGAT